MSIDLLAGNRKFPRLGLGGPPEFRERLMECMPPILIKVEREGKCGNHVFLQHPGRWVRAPGDEGVFFKPLRQLHLPRTECHSESAPNAAQLDSEFFSKKAAKSESERGALRVAAEVVPNAMKQALLGRGFSVGRRKTRRNAGVEEREVLVGVAPARRNSRRNAPEIPGIDAWLPWHGARAGEHFRASP